MDFFVVLFLSKKTNWIKKLHRKTKLITTFKKSSNQRNMLKIEFYFTHINQWGSLETLIWLSVCKILPKMIICCKIIFSTLLFYSLDKKLKTKFFGCWHFDFFYTLWIKRTRKLFSPSKKIVLLSPLFKVYKKVVKFSFTPIKNILVFSV